jgi:hypothetical protein
VSERTIEGATKNVLDWQSCVSKWRRADAARLFSREFDKGVVALSRLSVGRSRKGGVREITRLRYYAAAAAAAARPTTSIFLASVSLSVLRVYLALLPFLPLPSPSLSLFPRVCDCHSAAGSINSVSPASFLYHSKKLGLEEEEEEEETRHVCRSHYPFVLCLWRRRDSRLLVATVLYGIYRLCPKM